MKRVILIIIFFIELFPLFSNDKFCDSINLNLKQKNISFKMPTTKLSLNNENKQTKSHSKLTTAKKAGIALTVVGSTVLLPLSTPHIVLSILSFTNIIPRLLYPNVFYNFIPLYISAYTFHFFNSYCALLFGVTFLSVGIYLLNEPYISQYPKYYATKIIRNIGIAMLATSELPLAGLIALSIIINKFYGDIAHDNQIPIYSLDYALAICISVFAFLGHLIGGVLMTAVSCWFLHKRYGRLLAKITPDIAITHDDKKDYTDGYSVSVGMRVRI
jgi:hypothetical protein